MRIAVFVYNFPHKKTQDFLFRLFAEKLDVVAVLAADAVPLPHAAPALRVKPRHVGLLHPRTLCERLGWPYYAVGHAGEACAGTLKSLKVDVGVIAGARILKEPVLSAPPKGIVNFHPGILPQCRGLDALQWAVYEGNPIGVTAHLIDRRVDAGRIVLRQEIPVYDDDTFVDLSLRLQETQADMLPKALSMLDGNVAEFEIVRKGILHRKMPPEMELELAERWRQRRSLAKSKL